MTEEVQLRDQQLEDLTEEIKTLMAGLDKSKRRAQDLDEIEEKTKAYQTALDGIGLELKNVNNPVEKKNYQKKVREYKKFLRDTKNDFEWKKKQDTKGELLGDHKVDVKDLNSNNGLMDHGREVLAESKGSLERTLGVVAKTQEIGAATLTKVDDQNKQLEKIHNDVRDIDSVLARSNKVIKRIGRKMLTDKYLWIIIGLIVGAIIFIIAWKALGHKSISPNTPKV